MSDPFDHDKIVIDIARRIADSAPQRQGKYVLNAGIPWTLIKDLRAALWDRSEARRRR